MKVEKTYNEWLEENKKNLIRQYCNDVLIDEEKESLAEKASKLIDKYYIFDDIPRIIEFLPNYEKPWNNVLVVRSDILGLLKCKNIEVNLNVIARLKMKIEESKEYIEKRKKENNDSITFRLFDFNLLGENQIESTNNFIKYLEKITNKAMLERDLNFNNVKQKKMKI